ncbi:MAG: thioredoxin family protein [Caulobacteraceae bacterium]|nr:thioredoxin family protein [Caulobacteraceae bacterium]
MPRLILLLAGLLLLVAPAAASPAISRLPVSDAAIQRTERIEAELVPMSAWVAPGSTALVAVRQAIQPGWHTYWRNPGDSGGATTLNWTLPASVRAGDIVWPVPERQRLQSLMNYGYSGTVYLPVPVDIPADARPGTVLPLSVRALFLVCSDEMCVPDELTLTLDLTVRAGAAPLEPTHGPAIQRIVETAPRPAGITARYALEGGALTLSFAGGPLAGSAPAQAAFFPFEPGVIAHAAPQPGESGPDGLTLTLAAGGKATTAGLTGPVAGVLVTEDGAWEVEATVGPVLPGTTGGGALRPADDPVAAAPTGWSAFARAMVFALLGGLILNLMPCVFPILAMKAAALTASAHDPAEARRDGLAFLGGVLVSFLILAGLLLALRAGGQAIGWGFQLQSPAVIAALALLMLAVGLNLSGVFHVGAGVQGLAGTGPLSRLPGGVGAFFTGVLAVVVAAPCTAPFMAVALGVALLMPAPMALAVFLMLGLGLALPYLAVSLSPALLRRLPRPGPWMDRLKGVLAFPMYGTALWLVWVFSRQVGAEGLALLLASALTVAFALWLFGLAQADRAIDRKGVAPAVTGALALALGTALVVFAVRSPAGAVGADASAAALSSAAWSTEAVAAAQAQGRPVLVNFTADWCVTCKINERAALSSPRVATALEAANAVYLVGDWTRRDDAITLELERHGRSGVPLYLIYTPGSDTPRILPQLLTEGLVIDAIQTSRP